MRSLFVVALAACTHHRDIREAHDVDGDVEIELSGTHTVDAVAVRSAGQIAFVARDGSALPDHQITKVSETSHGRGALDGLMWGALIGAGGGVALGLASGDDECDTTGHSNCAFAFSAGGKAVIGAVAFGLLGGLVGTVAGAVMGSTIVYENPHAARAVRFDSRGITVAF